METLFVYGTLMPNCPNGHILENIVGKFVPATVTSKLIGAGIYVLKEEKEALGGIT